MGQQHRKVVKRRRRADYLERKKIEAAAKTVSRPKARTTRKPTAAAAHAAA